MSFTQANVTAMMNGMKTLAGDLMAPHSVDLYQGSTVQVKLRVGQRRAGSGEITAGAIAQNQYATIDAADWDAKVGRIPQRGDRVHWSGRRYAFEDVQIISPVGETVFYKCRLEG